MKHFNRIMLGKGGMFADQCKQEGYIGANFHINEDLTKHFPDNWKEFNKKYIPVFLKNNPDKTLEGSYYYRVGTETRMVTKEGEKEFLKRRPAQYESLKQ